MENELHNKKQNPLWENYLANYDKNHKWMREIAFTSLVPTTHYVPYTEEEFNELLKTNVQFKKQWGQ